mgnify:CR=1 FL=1
MNNRLTDRPSLRLPILVLALMGAVNVYVAGQASQPTGHGRSVGEHPATTSAAATPSTVIGSTLSGNAYVLTRFEWGPMIEFTVMFAQPNTVVR